MTTPDSYDRTAVTYQGTVDTYDRTCSACDALVQYSLEHPIGWALGLRGAREVLREHRHAMAVHREALRIHNANVAAVRISQEAP